MLPTILIVKAGLAAGLIWSILDDLKKGGSHGRDRKKNDDRISSDNRRQQHRVRPINNRAGGLKGKPVEKQEVQNVQQKKPVAFRGRAGNNSDSQQNGAETDSQDESVKGDNNAKLENDDENGVDNHGGHVSGESGGGNVTDHEENIPG